VKWLGKFVFSLCTSGPIHCTIGPCSLGVWLLYHGKNVQIHSKCNETQSKLGHILV
jgi:hypothetical protein